jgi:hypothetical protein
MVSPLDLCVQEERSGGVGIEAAVVRTLLPPEEEEEEEEEEDLSSCTTHDEAQPGEEAGKPHVD